VAKAFAVLEAVVGHLYLVVAVDWLGCMFQKNEYRSSMQFPGLQGMWLLAIPVALSGRSYKKCFTGRIKP